MKVVGRGAGFDRGGNLWMDLKNAATICWSIGNFIVVGENWNWWYIELVFDWRGGGGVQREGVEEL